jgi:hypothetical protein
VEAQSHLHLRQLQDPPLPNEVSKEIDISAPKEEEHPKETTAAEKEEYLLKVKINLPLSSMEPPVTCSRI